MCAWKRNDEHSFQKFTRHASAAALCHAPAWRSGRFHIGVPFEFLDVSRLYVRVMTGFYSHRKTARLRASFGNDAFWIPPRLWAYAAEHQPDGNLAEYTSEELAELLGCNKYASSMLVALKKCGFIDDSGMIHDWNQHNGYHERFAERAKKAAAARWSKEKSPTPPKEERDSGKGKVETSIATSIAKHTTSIPAGAGDGEHSAFIKGWTDNFKAQWGFDYTFDGGRDGKAVKTLLATKILRSDLLEIAKKAWNHQHTFSCKQASTIHGFCNNLNPIRTELKNGNQNTSGNRSRFADRNKGTLNEGQGHVYAEFMERQNAAAKT